MNLLDLSNQLKIDNRLSLELQSDPKINTPQFTLLLHENKAPALFVPPTDVYNLYNHYLNNDFANLNIINNLMLSSGLISGGFITPILLAVFCIYHEEGHFIDFISSGLTEEEFLNKSQEESTTVLEKNSARGPLSSIFKKSHENRAAKKLRDIPSEINADKHAIKRLKENISLINKLENKRPVNMDNYFNNMLRGSN